MKLVWKKGKVGAESTRKRPRSNPDLPFGADDGEEESSRCLQKSDGGTSDLHAEAAPSYLERLVESLQSQGNKFAEEGMYGEALSKWDAALRAAPGNAVLFEQKAQVLLELGDAWGAVKAATRATELDPSWAEAWITLARSQLNYGEPDAAIQSFDTVLAIKPDSEDAKLDRENARQLVDKRNQLRSSGSCLSEGRFFVVDGDEKQSSQD